MKLRPLLLALFFAPLGATAADEPVAELAPVIVASVRDPAVLPYAQVNALLRGLEQHGQGLFRMDFKLLPRDPKKPLVEPRLSLLQGDVETPIPVAADGRFRLPMLSVEDAKQTELVSNQAKGTLRTNGTIWLTPPSQALELGTVRRIVATAATLRGELLPWYTRWLFPKVDAVRICSRRAAWSMQWSEGGRPVAIELPVDPGKHDEIDPDDAAAKQRVCTTLTGQEPWPESARLVADPDTTLSVQWNR